MAKNIIIAFLLSWHLSNVFTLSFANTPNLENTIPSVLQTHFGASYCNLEHQRIGDSVTLKGLTQGALTLANGLILSYGDIVMFAGDLFGDPRFIISSCPIEKREACFNVHFETLAGNPFENQNDCHHPLKKVDRLKTYFTSLDKALALAVKQGLTAPEFYKKNASKIAKSLNQLTCGGSTLTPFIPFGDYITLASQNLDHFSPDAILAYQAGHLSALKAAQKGYQWRHNPEKSIQYLTLAYAKNAFANHFLSDAFAAGHLRVPRRALYHYPLPAVINLLIANLMHDEDGQSGLWVSNARGDSWFAVGDSYLFEPIAAQHKSLLLEAMQYSADSIYETFQTGLIPQDYEELALIPKVDDLNRENNTAPLFKLVNGIVMKRKQNHNPYAFEWQKVWSRIITLMDFKKFRQR